jgi:phage/plasmid-associated DNA primase
MGFPVELERVGKTNDLALHISNLVFFGGGPVIIPVKDIERKEFFDLTYEHSYTLQEMVSELERKGINCANAYRPIRTKKFIQYRPYRQMQTTTFRAYHIPAEMVKSEREKCLALARECTS